MGSRGMEPRTSWRAVASFAFMILLFLSLLLELCVRDGPTVASFFLWPGYVSIVFGLLAVIHVRLNPQRQRGLLLAVVSILVSGSIVTYVNVRNHHFRDLIRQSICRENLALMHLALDDYLKEHKAKLPNASRWNADLWPRRYTFHASCPTLKDRSDFSYAMNACVAGLRLNDIANPSEVVLIFESAPGRDLAGGANLFPHPARHIDGYAVLFCDGKVRMVAESRIGALTWQPRVKVAKKSGP